MCHLGGKEIPAHVKLKLIVIFYSIFGQLMYLKKLHLLLLLQAGYSLDIECLIQNDDFFLSLTCY